jgi:hypothetical protein
MIDSLGERIDKKLSDKILLKKFDRFQLTHKLDIELKSYTKGILRNALYRNFNPVRNFKNDYTSGIFRQIYRNTKL